ncbi:MAG: AmmeMemoRadiSam system protein B [Nitrospirae bacterium]|nr:AmmeMemoRadiSam system protein B [Nitrospirota bacterium]MBF0535171.1 AmmeMemoRadiSam system protein B [Nitrospirota bacterium]MBF0615210.1 AmmeMemoRadiSam system protein B [Nitrospirota bacterium]
MKRSPVVAGQFYKGGAAALEAEVSGYTAEVSKKIRAIGIISPHAGLMYSGAVAGLVYSRIEFPDTFILLGPNHTGLGQKAAVMKEGRWEIPTNSFEIDTDIAAAVLDSTPLFTEDIQAHRYEHSLEVQLPFIAHFSKTVKIVPVCFMYASAGQCKEAGEALAKVIQNSGKSVTIVASSDMSHYLPDAVTRQKDKLAMEKILALDPAGLYDVVKKEDITMCGVIPATVMMYAALKLGAKSAEVVKYATSGDVSGDYERVVGYAGVVIR